MVLQRPCLGVSIFQMKGKTPEKSNAGRVVTVNKKTERNFQLLERFEAGLALLGTEVKSLRAGQGDLSGAYGRIDENGQCWLVGANIAQYEMGGSVNHEPKRKRKLLLHKTEIRKIRGKLEQRGFTLVPIQIYFNEKGRAKVEMALGRGKRKYDKRRTMVEKQQKKDMEKGMRKYR